MQGLPHLQSLSSAQGRGWGTPVWHSIPVLLAEYLASGLKSEYTRCWKTTRLWIPASIAPDILLPHHAEISSFAKKI